MVPNGIHNEVGVYLIYYHSIGTEAQTVTRRVTKKT